MEKRGPLSKLSRIRLITTMSHRIAFLLLILMTLPSLALDPAHFKELNKQARSFAKQQDWKSMREVLIQIGHELPAETPNYMLRMASVETHLNNRTEALQWMRRYAA